MTTSLFRKRNADLFRGALHEFRAKKSYLQTRSLIRELKMKNPSDTWEGFGYPVRAAWAVERLTSTLRQIERDLQDHARKLIHAGEPISLIVCVTGLPLRQVKVISRNLRRAARDHALGLLSAGMKQKQIAQELGISLRTLSRISKNLPAHQKTAL